MAKTIKAPVLYREMQFDRKEVNEESRSIELSFSSEIEAKRWFGIEILDHKAESVDLRRLNAGGALLLNHNSDDQIGVVESAKISPDRKGRAVVRFGKSSRAEEIWNDVKDGVRRSVSVGYRIHKMVTEKVEQGVETMRALSWEPLEISIVSVPVDPTVGIGRADGKQEFEVEVIPMENRSMKLDAAPASAPASGGAPVKTSAEVASEWRVSNAARCKEIKAIAEKVGGEDARKLADVAYADPDCTVDDFKGRILEVCYKAKPVTTPEGSAEVGAGKKEKRQYSLVRAMNCIAQKQPVDGLEKELSDQVAKNIGRRAEGFFIPTDILEERFDESKELTKRDVEQLAWQIAGMKRALTSNVFSAGGALVGVDLLTGSMIELLRNKMVVSAMGARSLTGLVNDVQIPKQTGGATAYWLAQGAAGTRSQQTVGQVALTPRRLFAATAYDKQLLAQASLSVEAFVREDLMAVLAIEKDRAAINGSGASGEPLGILNQPSGSTSTLVTFATAAAPLWTEIIKFETNLATANADFGNLGFICTPAVRGHCKGFPKFASTGTPIWDQGDTLNGYRAMVSNQVPTAKSTIFGKWSDLIIADWDGMDVVVDPYTLSLNAQISVVLNTLTDIAIRNGKSFTYSTN